MLVRVAPGLFPPELVVQIKALACELPAKHGRLLSRRSTSDPVQQVQQSGLVASVSGSTLWRWLHEDAIRPWYHRSWVFPRDPDFATKAGRVLDLYARQWQGSTLKEDEFVISAGEKTKRRAFRRAAASMPRRTAEPHTPLRVAQVVFVRKWLVEIQYLRTTITDEQRREFERLVEDTIRRIESGEFLPHSGIRFPQNPCSSCPYVGLCLDRKDLAAAACSYCRRPVARHAAFPTKN